MSEHSTFEDIAKEIRRIISAAEKEHIPLRIMGGTAIRIHCSTHSELYDRLERTPKHDMDFVTYGKFRLATKRVLMELGYQPYVSLELSGGAGARRQIFNDKQGRWGIDVFFDGLQMCHVIDFKGRLEVDSPTVPLAELLLQKLQIVDLNEKDVQDVIILLLGHEVGSLDGDQINGEYVAKLLSYEWGFYYTATTNLQKVRELSEKYDKLTLQEKQVLASRIDQVRRLIEDKPKTMGWKLRARVGPSVKWYNVVEEVERLEES